ncbi:hypothetical [Yersinia pestis KIM10+]|uniref:Uncharacterized protein n=1 Tax=Yersinia pestis TaxID=632 RepID=Q8CK77_YERPE|nr:hypothetical [Yersinia pestis KIM10+]
MLLTDITADIQGNALAGLRLLCRLVLGMNTSHPHGAITASQPQGIAYRHLARQRGPRHH